MADLSNLAENLRSETGPGFQLFEQFCDVAVGNSMLEDVTALARSAASGEAVTPAVISAENQKMTGTNPEDLISKVFSLHRRPAFEHFLQDKRVRDIVIAAIGRDVDCFLSQFIFKNPGAWGQPWHQDSYYFPFTPARPIIGLWLAITRATLENGCLHILPGSQVEPVHKHIPDVRDGANSGYVEIADFNMDASKPCLLNPGDLMVFDSHLMHRSTDNFSDEIRAAMVWHFAPAGTSDRGIKTPTGDYRPNPINDWRAYIRDGELVL